MTATAYKNTIIVGGGKGGVGKSTCTQALLYYLQRAGHQPHLIESDTSNPDVAKAHQHKGDAPLLPIDLLDLDTEDGWLELLSLRAEHPDRIFVIATGSRNKLALDRFGPLFTAGLAELGALLLTVWMIDGNRDCLELLAHYRKVVPASRVCVLRNAHCARSFELYDNSKLRSELEASGGQSLTFPSLTERVAQTLNVHRLSLADAQTSDTLPFGHKVALRRWLTDVSTVLDEVITA